MQKIKKGLQKYVGQIMTIVRIFLCNKITKQIFYDVGVKTIDKSVPISIVP